MATTLAWRAREREREREELVTFLGQIPGKRWEYRTAPVTYDMEHDTHDTDDTYSHDSSSHLWDKVLACFYVKIVTKPKVLEGFRLARANVHFVSFFARDSSSLGMQEDEMSVYIVF